MPSKIKPEGTIGDALLMVRVPKKGRAIIATRKIMRGETIVSTPFIKMSSSDVESTDGRLSRYVWHDGFAAGAGSFFNHDDNPNADIKRKKGLIIFKAERDIGTGEEITIDYGYKISDPIAPVRVSKKKLLRMLGSKPRALS